MQADNDVKQLKFATKPSNEKVESLNDSKK